MDSSFDSIITIAVIIILALVMLGIFSMLARCYRKVDQGKVLIRSGGPRSPRISFSGMLVFPVIHKLEIMDLSLKRIEITRTGKDGLICQDNMRADIKVAFFLRVNKNEDDVKKVAMNLGCERASNQQTLIELFDAKFSEALKTVGKQFDFVDLYNSREKFKLEILQIIGQDLNGYVLEDCAIDYLEQTDLTFLNPQNILDAEGIKKITELTAKQKVLANQIDRDREKVIRKQDVEAREAILELDRQLSESTEKQQREIAAIKAREDAEASEVSERERLRAGQARINTDEELAIAEENKNRQVLVAMKNRMRTEAVEDERIQRDQMLEAVERERVVTLSQIERDRAIETERKNIQEVIRERVTVERDVVKEEEGIKDTRAIAEAERTKSVALTLATQAAEEFSIRETKTAEAMKQAATLLAQQKLIEAEAELKVADKDAQARMALSEAKAREEAAIGLAEVQVQEAKAQAIELQGAAEASVLEKSMAAEARGTELKAAATQKQGEAEALVLQRKLEAEAAGITEKAEAMRKFDAVSRDHEEFRLRLEKEKEIELAAIEIQKVIADSQARVLEAALKTAKIDIVGGDGAFLDKIMSAVRQGKSIDRMVSQSEVLRDVKNTFFSGDPEQFQTQMRKLVDRFGITSEEIRDLSVSALISRLTPLAQDESTRGILGQLSHWATKFGVQDMPMGDLPSLDG